MVNITGLYSKNSSKRRRKKELGFEDIQKFFDTPIKEASDQLGVSLTQLKRICRECDIPRWPYRKLQSIHNKISELKESLDTSDELTCDRIKNKITSLENEIQFIKTHPRSIVTSGNSEKRKRNSIQKKRWSLPSENALAALGDNASNSKRWSIGSGDDSGGEDDECFSSDCEDNDDEMFKQDPTYQDISNRFKGLLHSPPPEDSAPRASPNVPAIDGIISKAQAEQSKRLSLNPYVLKNLSTSIPKTPTQSRNPFEEGGSGMEWTQTQQQVPSLNLAGGVQRSMDNSAYTPRGSHVAGFYPPPNPHHSSQFVRPQEQQVSPKQQYAQQGYVPQQQYNQAPNPQQQYMQQQQYAQQQQQYGQQYVQNMPQQQPQQQFAQPAPQQRPQQQQPQQYQNQNFYQRMPVVQDLQLPYKPPQLVLPQRTLIQDNNSPLPRLSSMMDTKPETTLEDMRYQSPIHKRQQSLPSLPKFNELENQVDQYQQTVMRHHSPQYLPRATDPFHNGHHDPFMKNSHVPFAPSPLSQHTEEQRKENFIEKIFRKQIPFFKKRTSSPAPKVM